MATEHCHIVIPYHQPLFVVLTQPPHSILHAQVLGWAWGCSFNTGKGRQDTPAHCGTNWDQLLKASPCEGGGMRIKCPFGH